ncbi:MAG: hypothetical protein ACTSWP_06905 [Candidatus Freyarchaeota archaeon]|nr:hypothetical protein [Candidatus Freyrarchaeum guaymaensis]
MIIEGFFLETIEGFIFDVKGVVHPPDRVIAYLRYFPDPRGERERGGVRFRKVYSLEERERILRDRKPDYLYFDHVFGMEVEGVPKGDIAKVYDPRERLSRLLVRGERSRLEEAAAFLSTRIAEEAGVPIGSIGVSGSLLVSMERPSSDVDIVVFGKRNCWRAYEAMKNLVCSEGDIRVYGEEELRRLYEFRSKDTLIGYEDFARCERRKYMSGVVKSCDFFLRFVKYPDEYGEVYGERLYRHVGYALVEGVVADASDAIFTPCSYILDDVKVLEGARFPVREVVSFRGRFSDQAREGEKVMARGKVERVKSEGEEWFRLVVGGRREDFLIVKW